MTLKSYFWGMSISAFVAFIAWVLVVLYIDPNKSGLVGQALFYVSAFLFLSCLAIIFFTYVRKIFDRKSEKSIIAIGTSFRQGILISFLAIGLLILQQCRMLTWWDGALSVAGIFLIELYFLTKK
jgi:hypothetical protein